MSDFQSLLHEFGTFVADRIGAYVPPERYPDLERRMVALAQDLGGGDVESRIHYLMNGSATQPVAELLARHFAVGETYFFREPGVFHALEHEVLPPLIAARRAYGRRLRIWSAGCCSGEEVYSIAILLHRMIPDLADWDITLLGTDIHPGFLQKAVLGRYRDWSFRAGPVSIMQRYFERPEPGWHAVRPWLRRMARFGYLNLMDDAYSSGMDIVFCRNVLMYFERDQALRVVQKLRRALVPGGWLVTSQAEAGSDLFTGFTGVRCGEVVLYRREQVRPAATVVAPSVPPITSITPAPSAPLPPPPSAPPAAPPDASEYAARARRCADRGLLAEADHWCETAIAIDKCNAGLRYLRATILEQQGRLDLAMTLLRQAIYLDPHFVLAHFALGGLYRRRSKVAQARRHVANAMQALERYARNDILPESEGATAGWFSELIRTTEAMHEDTH